MSTSTMLNIVYHQVVSQGAQIFETVVQSYLSSLPYMLSLYLQSTPYRSSQSKY